MNLFRLYFCFGVALIASDRSMSIPSTRKFSMFVMICGHHWHANDRKSNVRIKCGSKQMSKQCPFRLNTDANNLSSHPDVLARSRELAFSSFYLALNEDITIESVQKPSRSKHWMAKNRSSKRCNKADYIWRDCFCCFECASIMNYCFGSILSWNSS